VPKDHIKLIADNRKARHDYFIEDEFEAGMVLTGTEVKSLRQGRANLKDAYARIKKGEVWVHQMHISPYTFAYYDNHEPLRVRKLLLHQHEIKQLYGKMNERGYALTSISATARSNSSWPWPRARKNTTNGNPSAAARNNGTWTATAKSTNKHTRGRYIDKPNRFIIFKPLIAL